MKTHVPRAKSQVVQSYLTRRVFAVTGLLGSGKTQCLERDVVGVARRDGWETCSVNQDDSSTVRVFKKLASHIKSRSFDKAFKSYSNQFRPTDRDVWLQNLKAVADVWEALAIGISVVAPLPALAMEVGSKALPPEQFARIVTKVKVQTGGDLEILASNPLQYLADALEQDFRRLNANERILIVVDDYELFQPLLRDWLFQFIKASRYPAWALVCWQDSQLPSWFPDDSEQRILNLDEHLIAQDDIKRLWDSWDPKQPVPQRDMQNISLPLSGPSYIPVVSERDKSSLDSISEQLGRFQSPPTFGLPIYASGFLNRLESSEACWRPMLDHLVNWLRFDYAGDEADQVRHCLIEYSAARYLDEDIIRKLTPDRNLWLWLDRSPLLVGRSVCGEQKKAFDRRLRCILSYELYRSNPKRYFSLHEDLDHYYQDMSVYPGYYEVEKWYHQLLYERVDIWKAILNKFLDSLYNDDTVEFSGYVLEVLEDIHLENPNTLFMGEWVAPAREALDVRASSSFAEDWPGKACVFLEKIMKNDDFDILTPANRENVRLDYNKCIENDNST